MKRTRQAGALLGTLIGTMAAALAIGAGIAAGEGVEPSSYSNTLASGSSVTIGKTVHTPAIPANPDIVLLSDTTGSMGFAIGNVQANASSIMETVEKAQPPGATAEFGVADYKDGTVECPIDPYAFNLGQPLTTNLAAAQGSIGEWTAFGGCDEPESQVNALYTLATSSAVGFRSGSSRIIVWFGDAPGLDPDLGHTLTEAIEALVAAHIRVIAIPVAGGSGLDSTGQATAVASATGGEVLPEASPEEVSAKILEGLSNLPVTVTPTPSCDSGLSATYDAPSKTVPSGNDATFEETLSVAPGMPGGTLHCTVDFLLNGASVSGFQQSVTITVPGEPVKPVCGGLTATPSSLWPPNHKLHTVAVTGASSPDGKPLTYTITSITQDEPLTGKGSGNSTPDAFPGTESGEALIRAERAGAGDGRVYALHITVSDGEGGECTGIATVSVPHDHSGRPAVDSGQKYTDF